MKRPSFQFYPSDWLRDTALRSCSPSARGLWIDMICFMHEGNPYGHLKVGNKVILPPNLASMVGATLVEVEGWLYELHQAGVYELAEDGEIYSKRMVRDESLRNKRAEGGKLGGNPNLKVNLKVISMVEKEVKQKPTPSSSSSSSSSNINTPPEGVSEEVWQEFTKHRKTKKAAVTPLVIKGIAEQAQKAGWTLENALKETVVRNWQSFNADWVTGKNAPSGQSTLPKTI